MALASSTERRAAHRSSCAPASRSSIIFSARARCRNRHQEQARRVHGFERRRHGAMPRSRSCGSADAPACHAARRPRRDATLPATRSCGISSAKTSIIPPSCGVDGGAFVDVGDPDRARRRTHDHQLSRRGTGRRALRKPGRTGRGRDAVLIDNRFPEFSLPIAQAAKKSGRIVLMDADDPTRHTDALLNACTHVVFSSHGLRTTAQMQDFERALERRRKRHPRRCSRSRMARTACGGMTGVASAASRRIRSGPWTRSGPGTSSTAPACWRWRRAAISRVRLRFSAAAAAVKCTRFGGIGGAPNRAEVEDFPRLALRPILLQ